MTSSAPPPPTGTPAPLRITPEDLARAAPRGASPERTNRVSQLAVASFVLALLGIPLVGFLLGPIAIGCGVIALGAFHGRSAVRGFRLAVAGIVIGGLDLLGWIAALVFVVYQATTPAGASPPLVDSSLRSAGGIADAPPHIRRALRANLLVRCRSAGGGESTGSAVVVGRDGDAYLALTNRHAAECGGGARLTAATLGGEPREAVPYWEAPEGIDAVVLRIATGPADRPEVVPVRTGDLPSVGDPVFAIGNPLGYEASFTGGVLSAIRRTRHGGAIQLRILQVQVSMNPGNSGGGLYDAQGRLIGLNTWAVGSRAEGIGFAIAVQELAALAQERSVRWGDDPGDHEHAGGQP